MDDSIWGFSRNSVLSLCRSIRCAQLSWIHSVRRYALHEVVREAMSMWSLKLTLVRIYGNCVLYTGITHIAFERAVQYKNTYGGDVS